MAVSTIEGTFQDALRYHYDVAGDVLYVRLLTALDDDVYGDNEDQDGLIPLRSVADGRLVGFTVWSFWQRFGAGEPSLLAAGNPEDLLESPLRRLGGILRAA